MRRLGYDRYGTHGNDAGAYVAPEVARSAPDQVVGVHVNADLLVPVRGPRRVRGADRRGARAAAVPAEVRRGDVGLREATGHQAAEPGARAGRFPAGQLAWIGQLLGEAVSPDVVVTNAAIYWFTNTGASSARFYYEDAHAEHPTEPTTAPTGLSSFAFDFKPLRRFAERDHHNIVSWNDHDRGGHWAAHDAPDLLIDDIRQFFRQLR